MRVGNLGSVLMGGKLGTIFAHAGHEVIFSYACSEEKLRQLARDAHGNVRAGTPSEVVAHTSSGAEELTRRLPKARVVSAFITVRSEVLFGVFEARSKGRRRGLVYCSDYASGKGVAAELIRGVGFDPLDAGLHIAWVNLFLVPGATRYAPRLPLAISFRAFGSRKLRIKRHVALRIESAKNNQAEEFRNGTQKKWLSALRQRTGRVFYRHGTH